MGADRRLRGRRRPALLCALEVWMGERGCFPSPIICSEASLGGSSMYGDSWGIFRRFSFRGKSAGARPNKTAGSLRGPFKGGSFWGDAGELAREPIRDGRVFSARHPRAFRSVVFFWVAIPFSKEKRPYLNRGGSIKEGKVPVAISAVIQNIGDLKNVKDPSLLIQAMLRRYRATSWSLEMCVYCFDSL